MSQSPIILSTWSFGQPANRAAWPILERGGSSIDAVEAAWLGWHAALSWNRSDIYELFGPTRVSRKGYAAKLGYDYPIIYDLPRRLDICSEVAFYDSIDALPVCRRDRVD